jgi:hypothetical protein
MRHTAVQLSEGGREAKHARRRRTVGVFTQDKPRPFETARARAHCLKNGSKPRPDVFLLVGILLVSRKSIFSI